MYLQYIRFGTVNLIFYFRLTGASFARKALTSSIEAKRTLGTGIGGGEDLTISLLAAKIKL